MATQTRPEVFPADSPRALHLCTDWSERAARWSPAKGAPAAGFEGGLRQQGTREGWISSLNNRRREICMAQTAQIEKGVVSKETLHKLRSLLDTVLSEPVFEGSGLTVHSRPSDFRRFSALAQGTACWITVENAIGVRCSNRYTEVLVRQQCSLAEVRRAVQFHWVVERKVSWRRVWQHFTLGHEGKPLPEGQISLTPDQTLQFLSLA